MQEAEARALDILTKNRLVLEALAEALIKEEVLDKAEIERIIAETRGKTTAGAPGA